MYVEMLCILSIASNTEYRHDDNAQVAEGAYAHAAQDTGTHVSVVKVQWFLGRTCPQAGFVEAVSVMRVM